MSFPVAARPYIHPAASPAPSARPLHPSSAADPVKDKKKEEPPPPQKTEWLGRVVVIIAVVAVVCAVAYCLYELTLYTIETVREKFSKKSQAELEEEVRRKGLGDLLNKVKQIHTINTKRVIKRLAECKEDACEIKILKHLDKQFEVSVEHLKEILMGAHIRLVDKGETYTMWMKLEELKGRISSHPSNGKQFSIRGLLVRELLFGDITDKERIHTWFQCENHPVTWGHIFRHMVDYVKYKISSANQGPYGSSFMTDKTPLYLYEKSAAPAA